jgi:hypothetical protein
MAKPILEMTRGVPTTDRGWMEIFRNLTKFLRVSGDSLVIAGDIELPPESVSTAEIEDEAVTDAKLRLSQATSVIGRSINSAGVPSDIQATLDGQFLHRSAGILGFASLADSDIPSTITRDSELTSAIAAHEAAADPHPDYATSADVGIAITAHAGEADPHPGYTTAAELATALTSYPEIAATETITGSWTFTQRLTINSAAPEIRYNENDGGTDAKVWNSAVTGGIWIDELYSDALSSSTEFRRIARTGMTVDEVRYTATLIRLNGAVRVDASTTTSAPSAGGAGALPATPAGYVTINIGGTNRQIAYY